MQWNAEEKKVKYFKHLDKASASSIPDRSGVSSRSKRILKSSKSSLSSSSEGKFAQVKELFLNMLEQHDEGELTYIWFEHDFLTGVTRKTVHSKKANAKE